MCNETELPCLFCGGDMALYGWEMDADKNAVKLEYSCTECEAEVVVQGKLYWEMPDIISSIPTDTLVALVRRKGYEVTKAVPTPQSEKECCRKHKTTKEE